MRSPGPARRRRLGVEDDRPRHTAQHFVMLVHVPPRRRQSLTVAPACGRVGALGARTPSRPSAVSAATSGHGRTARERRSVRGGRIAPGTGASAPEPGAVGLLDRGDAPGAHLGHLLVGQGPVRGAQPQAVGQAPRARRHAGPPVDVEQAPATRAARPRPGATSSPPRRRARRRRPRRPGRHRSTGTGSPGPAATLRRGASARSPSRSTSSHPTRRRSASSPKASSTPGVDLTHDADGAPASSSPARSTSRRRPRRVQTRGDRRRARDPSPRPGATSSTSSIPKASASTCHAAAALRASSALPRQGHAQHLVLVDDRAPRAGQGPGHPVGAGGRKDMADLEEPDLTLTAIGVEGERPQHARAAGSGAARLSSGVSGIRHLHPAFDPHPSCVVGTEQRRRSTPRGRRGRPPPRAPGAARVGSG